MLAIDDGSPIHKKKNSFLSLWSLFLLPPLFCGRWYMRITGLWLCFLFIYFFCPVKNLINFKRRLMEFKKGWTPPVRNPVFERNEFLIKKERSYLLIHSKRQNCLQSVNNISYSVWLWDGLFQGTLQSYVFVFNWRGITATFLSVPFSAD